MSIQVIYYLQQQIYKLLHENSKISEQVKGIYFNVQQDVQYPIILVQMVKLNRLEAYLETYELDFLLSILVREKGNDLSLQLASEVIAIFQPDKIKLVNYEVIGLRYKEAKWEFGHDLLTTKLSLKYQGLLQQRVRAYV